MVIKTSTLAVTLALALWTVGCGPAVTLRMLEPAAVTVPPHVETVALVDRSRPSNAGEGILGVIEGVFTGEAIGVDTEGRAQALQGLASGLANSPRFRVVKTITSRDEVESSLFDEGLGWAAASALCEQVGCQGIVALEAFDSDSRVDTSVERERYKDDEGDWHSRAVHVAQRETHVLVAWRLYDVAGTQVVDDMRDHARDETWEAKGKSEGDARRDLPSQYDTVRQLAFESGEIYAARIAPTWILVRRSYFGGGDDRLKQAKIHVKADDWPAAREIWLGMAEDPDLKLRGKAEFNLALAAEVEGLLTRAVEWGRLAAEHFPKAKVRGYLYNLERRVAAQEVLREQLEGAPE